MQSISAFLDIAKFVDFWWKSADVNRTQNVCHVIYIVFRSSLGKVLSFIIVGFVSSPEKAHPE